MRIIELKAENIKKIKAIEIHPGDKTLIQITGKNGAGKTSVLDAIMFAIGGEKHTDKMPIREGQKRGEVRIDIGDYVVKRIFTEKGSRVEVSTKDGMVAKSPQEILNGFIGNLSFDPLEFVRLDKKKQVEILRELTGVDTRELDAKYQEAYEQRTVFNKRVQEAEANINGRKHQITLPKEETPARELVARITIENKRISSILDLEARKFKTIEEIKQLEHRVVTLKEELLIIESGYSVLAKEGASKIESLKTEFDALEETNRAIRENNTVFELFKTYNICFGNAQKLSETLENIKQEKLNMISSAKMPVPGLSFDDTGIMFNGIPFEQINDGEKLKVSIAIAMALNPKLRVVRITNGSLLDSDNLKIIETMAKDNDFQVWVESVDETGKVGIVIEDGEIKVLAEGGVISEEQAKLFSGISDDQIITGAMMNDA